MIHQLSFFVYFLLFPHFALSEVSNSSIKKEGLQTTSDSQLQVAQSGSCPISMPEMASPVVFQSVEAPQIEPMDEQAPLPYNNYDLVKGKPAGVLIYLREEQMNGNHEFILNLKIHGVSGFINNCFHSPFISVMLNEDQDVCSFTREDLRNEDYYKFIPLPMNKSFLNREGTFTITATIYPRGYNNNRHCLKNNRTFRIKVIETEILDLGFTRINAEDNCYESYDYRTGLYDPNTGYDPVSYRVVEDFVYSDEVQFYIESMFPVEKAVSSALNYILEERSYNYVKGDCNNEQALDSSLAKDTKGLLADIDELEQIREDLSYSKIIAIVPESYFVFHGHANDEHQITPAGMAIRPQRKKRYEKWWSSWLNKFVSPNIVGGSWNVVFVRSNEKNEGTVSHELAHALGQGRELYEEKELCRHFKTDEPVFCHNKKFIPIFLHAGIDNKEQFWALIPENRYTFMSNRGDIGEQWIDRDTYQKLLWTLSRYGSVIEPEKDLYKERSSLREREEKISCFRFL